jgi:hypothetical protein
MTMPITATVETGGGHVIDDQSPMSMGASEPFERARMPPVRHAF